MAAQVEETTNCVTKELNHVTINDELPATSDREVADGEEDEDIVDPWKVVTKSAKGVDTDKLISKLVIA